MPGRIITLQRQARELGRLRTGYTETYTKDGQEKTRPVRSKTFILTSPQPDYLTPAAEEWGGTVERWQPQGNHPEAWRLITQADAIDAILPPGDPLSQANEMWNKGGAVRRCDGERDAISGQPCVCAARFGDEWFQRGPTEVCRPYSRLSVLLPQLPDLGVWRIETKSYYAAGEMAAVVDLIKASVGPDLLVPIRLRIEPRTRVAGGKTTPYPVIVVETRGATAGQLLAGSVPSFAISGAPQRAALTAEAAPAPNGNGRPKTAEQYLALARVANGVESVRALWKDAAHDGVLTEQVKAVLSRRAADLDVADAAGEPTPPPTVVAGEVEPDRESTWMAILGTAHGHGWNTTQTSQAVRGYAGRGPEECDGFELAAFLEALRDGRVPA